MAKAYQLPPTVQRRNPKYMQHFLILYFLLIEFKILCLAFVLMFEFC